MTREQQEKLHAKWDLYSPERQREIFTEYFANGGACCQKSWEHYLEKKLKIKGCRKKVEPMSD